MKKFQNPYWVLVFIFIINFLFKLIYLGQPSFWYDEIISAQDTLLDFGHIKHESEWDKNPPFYYYLLWIWAKLFGISEFGLRSMSVFFSSLTAVLIYSFSLKISNKTSAILATLIFTFHPSMYYYAQEARCFSLLIFLTTINLILVYSLIRNPKIFKAFLLGALNFLIFYTHYLAGLILFCQFIYLAILFRKRVALLLCIYATPIALVLLRFTKKQYNVLFFSQQMSKEKNNVPIASFDYLTEGTSLLFVSNIICILFIVFLILFLAKGFKQKELWNDKEYPFKLFVVITPVLCIVLLFLLGKWTNVFHGRYLLYTMPYIILSIFIFADNKFVLYAVVLITFCFEMSNFKFNQSKRMDYRFAAFLAKEIQKKEDVYILIQTHDVINLFTYYYDRNIFEMKQGSKEFREKRNIYDINELEDLRKIHFNENIPILFYQTYQKQDDEVAIENYFKDRNYHKFTTYGIEGLKFTYLRKTPFVLTDSPKSK